MNLSDVIFSCDGVESISINRVNETCFSVKTNLNRRFPFVVDTSSMSEYDIKVAFKEHVSGDDSPKIQKDTSYKSRMGRMALLVDVSLDEVCGWSRTDMPSGRVVIDATDPTKTPMVVRRDRNRAGGGVASLEDHWVVSSQNEIPAANLIDISGAAK